MEVFLRTRPLDDNDDDADDDDDDEVDDKADEEDADREILWPFLDFNRRTRLSSEMSL